VRVRQRATASEGVSSEVEGGAGWAGPALCTCGPGTVSLFLFFFSFSVFSFSFSV
jgi:hypothetical protein